jgi:hypothetical protein
VAVVVFFASGCGPTDYQKPITEFNDAAARVITVATDFYTNYNFLETRNTLSQTAVQGGEVKLKATPDHLMTVDVPAVIDQGSIDVRLKALTVLSQYIANLAELASGKAGDAVGHETDGLSKTLSGAVTDAQKLADVVDSNNGSIISNSKFASLAGPVASAIGAVAQLIVSHKSRQAIEQSVEKNQGDVDALMDLLSREMAVIYERQKSSMRLRQTEAVQVYTDARKQDRGLAARLAAIDQIVAAERETELLRAADPQPAVDKMKATFDALVTYAKSNKNPTTVAGLFAALQDFVTETESLAAASQALVAALQ